MKLTQEEKQLLLKDLCGRLFYGVYVDAYSWQKDTPKLLIECVPEYVGAEIVVHRLAGRHSIREIKPYLRPMSSMTEEERKEYESFIFTQHHEWDGHGTSTDYVETDDVETYFTWLNKKGFDYRGLIPMGLALEAPEDMYD